jgi:HSP20 family protein
MFDLSRSEIEKMMDSLDMVFVSMFPFESPTGPHANITKIDSNLELDVALPGLSRSDIEVTVEEGILTVKVNSEKSDGPSKNRVVEWQPCSQTRSWILPPEVRIHQISSRYEAGVLSISIPTDVCAEKITVPVE